jgi:Spy/CpxP family protein refolding chaperone
MRGVFHKTMLLCCSLLLTGAVAFGQGHGQGGGPGGGGAGGGRPTFGVPGSGPSGVAPNGRSGYPGETPGSRGGVSPVRGGLQLGPPGRWWDDKTFAKTLGLTKDQQKRMDTVFNANKGPILESYKALQKEESSLQKLTREKKLDEARIFAGIDAVAQARATLEKANAHMLLLVRQEMDEEQNARMEKYQEPPADD